MEITSSQPYNGFGSSTQSVRRSIALPSGSTLKVTSRGRAHQLSVDVLSTWMESPDLADGKDQVHLTSSLVEGVMPHQGIDETISMCGYRLRVRSSGRAHTVELTAVATEA